MSGRSTQIHARRTTVPTGARAGVTASETFAALDRTYEVVHRLAALYLEPVTNAGIAFGQSLLHDASAGRIAGTAAPLTAAVTARQLRVARSDANNIRDVDTTCSRGGVVPTGELAHDGHLAVSAALVAGLGARVGAGGPGAGTWQAALVSQLIVPHGMAPVGAGVSAEHHHPAEGAAHD